MKALKEGLNRAAISRLAANLKRGDSSFAEKRFVAACSAGLDKLELKERVSHVAEALHTHLPADYESALRILLAARKNWDAGDSLDSLRGFAAWPLFEYIAIHGQQHLRKSMNALRDLTGLFTAEFAVRPFILHHGNESMVMIRKWASHKDAHVRRLASEGLRPRLPWATKIPRLIEFPDEGLEVLELLKDDPSEYVRRSVGNHLNDVAKDHPDRVIAICKRWLEESPVQRRWIVERATRTLVKQGYPKVWSLLGFNNKAALQVAAFKVTPRIVTLGGALEFSFKVSSTAQSRQKLAIDYAMHFKKSDSSTRAKVFKLKVVNLEPGHSVSIQKRHALKEITTRKYYPGAQKVELLINGKAYGTAEFQLKF